MLHRGTAELFAAQTAKMLPGTMRAACHLCQGPASARLSGHLLPSLRKAIFNMPRLGEPDPVAMQHFSPILIRFQNEMNSLTIARRFRLVLKANSTSSIVDAEIDRLEIVRFRKGCRMIWGMARRCEFLDSPTAHLHRMSYGAIKLFDRDVGRTARRQ